MGEAREIGEAVAKASRSPVVLDAAGAEASTRATDGPDKEPNMPGSQKSTLAVQHPCGYLPNPRVLVSPSRPCLSYCRCTNRGTEASMSGAGGVMGAGLSYQKFVHAALEQTRTHTAIAPHPSQEKFKFIKTNDENTAFGALSFSAPKIRLLRSLTIEKKNSVQVLDFAALSEPEYDLPIFCANAFTTPTQNIVVLDLNPLYDVTVHKDYKDKYYRNLMHLVQKFSELLPWGGKITSESLRFFSPIVIWTIFEPTEANQLVLHSALTDYYKVWLELMDLAVKESDTAKVAHNREAQHKYLTWRAEKDPGYPLLKRLIGESHAKDLVREFLFEGVDSLGTKSFLDYFPEYARDDGTVNKKRSMMGKSFETRPWDANGEFIG